jgi:hypothetical protein
MREGGLMRVETLLPIGKVDPGLRDVSMRLDLSKVPDMAREVEALGYDGLVNGCLVFECVAMAPPFHVTSLDSRPPYMTEGHPSARARRSDHALHRARQPLGERLHRELQR